MMFRPRSLVSLFACTLALVARTAHADPSASEISAARHAFETAVSLENDQHWTEAALELRRAIAVKDTPGLRFHLAHCETEQGHLLQASLEYERASALLHQGANAPDVQKLLGPASDALKLRLARLSLDLPVDLHEPTASVDGKAYPSTELAQGLVLDPGRHEIRVAAVGRRNFERVLVLKEGERVALRPELAVSAPPSTAPLPSAGTKASANAPDSPATERAPAPVHEGGMPSAKVYLLIGESALTVAGLAVGIGYRVAASSATDRVNGDQANIDRVAPNDIHACTAYPELTSTCSDLRASIHDHDHAAAISNVGFLTAGIAAAALVTTWLVYPNTTSHGASGLQVLPVAGLGSLGLVGRF